VGFLLPPPFILLLLFQSLPFSFFTFANYKNKFAVQSGISKEKQCCGNILVG